MTPSPTAHPELARRAITLKSPVRQRSGLPSQAWAAGLVLILVAACGGGTEAQAESESTPQDQARRRVEQLLEAMRPIDETVTSDIQDRWLLRKDALLASLCEAGPEVGDAALEAFRGLDDELPAVRRGILRVAARNQPEKCRPLLEGLFETYGPHLGIREEAMQLLAETSPARAIEMLEPVLRQAKPNRTLPPIELLLDAYVVACDGTGHDPIAILADVATNIHHEDSARHRATRGLRGYKDPRSAKALEELLVESGTPYLRRLAAQGLRDILPGEESCMIFEHVAEREADSNMLVFLADLIEKNCE